MVVLLQVVLARVYGGRDSSSDNPSSMQQSTKTQRLLATDEEVTCVAWRATNGCSPEGPRRSNQAVSFFADTDLSCQQYVPNYGSGYCELTTSKGETIKAFKKSCTRGKLGPFPFWKEFVPVFRCDRAVEFLNYKHRAQQYQPTKTIQVGAADTPPTRGIIMQIYPSAMPSVYAIIKLLRVVHKCSLPVELWHIEGEMTEDHHMVQHLVETFDAIHPRTISKQDMGSANSYLSKPYAIAYSQFDQVLFLDSDNFPIKDPNYLFETPEFQSNSAIFWKDFWSPKRNDYVLTEDSLVWELLGIDTKTSRANQEMEMESGQLVIDRRKSVPALQALMFLTQTFSEWLEPLVLVWGDKDLFRLAWHMTKSPFHYTVQPPSLAGKDVALKNFSYDKVCGITMVQHDPEGGPLFFHRNIAKISTEADLVKVWQKGSKFVGTNPDVEYEIEGSRSFYHLHGCYHDKPNVRGFFEEIDYRGSNVEHFEEKILQFAKEGLNLRRAK